MEIAGSIAATDMTITLATNDILDSLYSPKPLDTSPAKGFSKSVS